MVSPYDPTNPSRPVLARKRTSDKTASEEPAIDADSPTDSLDGKGKTRARINMACIHCRHRKIKCDGAQPSCATCTRLRRECEYEPVTEYENLMSRERKRRNKEKKAVRMASLGIFAGQSPLSMLHPSTSLGLPSAPLAHYADPSQPQPLFVSIPDASVESQFGPRRRRGISETEAVGMSSRLGPLSPMVPDAFQQASVSQPPTPAQTYRFYQSLASSPVMPLHTGPTGFFPAPLSAPLMPHANSGPFFAFSPQQTMMQPQLVDLAGLSASASVPMLPTGGRASATDADLNLGLVDMADVPTVVPTSAHVRPIDLPAPHGHFDFASIPFPTASTFALELPMASLRRRSSIHLPVGTADAFRRPSVAELAAAGLMQRVVERRAAGGIKEATDELTEDSTGILAWNAHVQSQLPAGMASWSGFQAPAAVGGETPSYPGSADYAFTVPTDSRSNSDGMLTLGPLSPPPALKLEADEVTTTSSVSSTVDTGNVNLSYFTVTEDTKPTREVSPFALSPSSGNSSNGNQSSLLSQDAWGPEPPLLSPVSELNSNFHSFAVFHPQDKSDDFTGSLASAFNSTF
ncbi:Zn(2)-C6 fungal-type DNA-binding domain protein [Kalmanozyma brasiliensis GHG001]|uniref:Zn(2)-C6 fungal-type domain-containing protein n=1 Tax=Kalmanozyma brasiliensis (strain GHG001) TaxID=1365824 RepID=V5EMH1_KALBG|nr:Zn(2)-C6 fungal-type DNA-binding domain protein [Kalmanozyma brasiliensis GHG001]EST06335.1 Zn(2)-C6 fungal-type DNA-binding domain protein [Kalmanozyma brasiliensis GHG001]